MKNFSPDLTSKYHKLLELQSFRDLFKLKPLAPTFNPAKEALLIRHALSSFNFTYFTTELELGQDTLKTIRLEPKLLDSRVHQLGLAHAAQASSYYHPLKFQTVLVSPMRRTIDTMIALFKDHPEREKIEFILLPELRQLFESIGDISSNNIESFTELQENLLKHHSISLNLSYVQKFPYAWQLATMQGEMEEDANQIMKHMEEEHLEAKEITQYFIKHMVGLMKESTPRYEKLKHLYLRARDTRKLIKEFVEKKKDSEKIVGVVTHSALIRNMTAEYFDEQKGRQIGGQSLLNCEGLFVEV